MNVVTLPPSRKDAADLRAAINALPGSWGNVDEEGVLRLAANPHRLWIMLRSSADQVAQLWRQAGISTGPNRSFAAMQSAKEWYVEASAFKVKKSMFSSIWVGSVSLQFDQSQIEIGYLAGRDQGALWRHLRSFLEGTGRLYDDADTALASV